jgi:hypothetical protein
MSDATYFPDDKVRVVAHGPHPRGVKVSIGDHLIPVYSVDVHMSVDELTTITMTTRADEIDVDALQQKTRIEIIGPDEGESDA